MGHFPLYNRYAIYGLVLESDLALALPPAPKSTDFVVELREGPSKAFEAPRKSLPPPHPTDWTQLAILNDGSIFMRWDDWLEFIVSPGGEAITYNRLTRGSLESFEAYIATFAVSTAIIQRGEEPLHATVLDFGGQAAGLLGHSGAGKSTLAAYLLGQGAALVTDDMLRVVFRDGGAFAQPGPQRLKLLEEAAELYMSNSPFKGRWNPLASKYLFETDGAARSSTACPLSAFFALDQPGDASADSVTLEKLEGIDLFRMLSASTMNSRIMTSERLARQFRFAEMIGRSIPVYRLAYPRRHSIFPEVAEKIARHMP